MKLDGKDIKTMTKEEIDNFIKDVENNPLFRATIRSIYGSVGNLKDLINKELEDVGKEGNKKLSKETEEDNIQNPFIAVKERNNIGKKCKIYGHEDIRDGREGVIQDIVELTQSYVININSNIVYASFNQVKIIEDWQDIVLETNDKDIIIKKDNIVVYDYYLGKEYKNYRNTYKLDLDSGLHKKLIENINTKDNKKIVIKYILAMVSLNNITEKIKKLENKRDKLENDYKSYNLNANELLKELM